MAGLAMHPSAEPNTLVVRHDDEQREWLIADAPETYYLTITGNIRSCWCVCHMTKAKARKRQPIKRGALE